MSGITQLYGFARSASALVGQQAYTTPGTYTWVAPAGVTSVSVVAVGGGGGGYNCVCCGCWIGGDGGSLAYKNNYAVTPGSSYTVKVGAGAVGGTFLSGGGASCFSSATVVKANGGFYTTGYGIPSGGWVGTGGSKGGAGGYGYFGTNYVGGGGAAGYDGNNNSPFTVGKGGIGANSQGNANVCGGGGGGGTFSGAFSGGGVGILGKGVSGAASNTYGNGGSGGANGATTGGLYGGGGSIGVGSPAKSGGSGAVRIIWGAGRAFPATNTGDL